MLLDSLQVQHQNSASSLWEGAAGGGGGGGGGGGRGGGADLS